MITDYYCINENTLALLPAKQIEYDTIVVEKNRKINIRKTPLELIKVACIENWCTYEGRRQAVIHNMNIKRKVPIPISIKKGIYLFPTHSLSSFYNTWISFQHIKTTIEIPHKPAKSKIIFFNGTELTLNISIDILQKQIQRTFECMYRMENMERKALEQQKMYLL